MTTMSLAASSAAEASSSKASAQSTASSLHQVAWTPSSWRNRPVGQSVGYPSQDALDATIRQLAQLPGLVTPHEIDSLRAQLAAVAQGRAFLLQGGDCAELFADCTPDKIEGKVKLLLLMSLIIIWGARIPVVRVGRIAGQYAKPRSKATEMVDVAAPAVNGQSSSGSGSSSIDAIAHKPDVREVYTFRGDNINGFGPHERTPDPARLLSAYFYSCTTLNHIRASLGSGLADLHAPLSWTTSHVRSQALARQFSQIVTSLTDALDFMRVIGADTGSSGSNSDGNSGDSSNNNNSATAIVSKLETVDYFISHECLTLEYEEALTRPKQTPERGLTGNKKPSGAGSAANHPPYYDLSAHFVWLGDRTRSVDGAHAEFVRGISNPIGIKVGPSMRPDELLALLHAVDGSQGQELGRVTLIARFGRGKSAALLPALIDAVNGSPWAQSAIWCCDPMHGNTVSSPSDPSLKTRAFGDVLTELTEQLEIHAQCGSRLGGIHLELTGEVDEAGDSVTECTGGAMGLEDAQLRTRYRTHCDPRLNLEQSLDIAFVLSNALKGRRLSAAAGAGAVPHAHRDELVSELLGSLVAPAK